MYYFLGTALPELQIGLAPDISVQSLDFLFRQNLSASDYEKVKVIRRFFDLENIRAFWASYPLDDRGNLDDKELEEALVTKTVLPDYLFDFMDRYESIEMRLKNFSSLFAKFFHEEIAKQTGFLKKWLQMERNTRLILVALRAKKFSRDLLLEMQYEDPEDDLVAQILSQKDAPSYEPPAEYEELKLIFEANQNNPLELHKAILDYRFRKIGELTGLQVFTIDRILAYFYQLILADKWMQLDLEKGRQIINTIVLGVS